MLKTDVSSHHGRFMTYHVYNSAERRHTSILYFSFNLILLILKQEKNNINMTQVKLSNFVNVTSSDITLMLFLVCFYF